MRWKGRINEVTAFFWAGSAKKKNQLDHATNVKTTSRSGMPVDCGSVSHSNFQNAYAVLQTHVNNFLGMRHKFIHLTCSVGPLRYFHCTTCRGGCFWHFDSRDGFWGEMALTWRWFDYWHLAYTGEFLFGVLGVILRLYELMWVLIYFY
jgi:hypothetical protein